MSNETRRILLVEDEKAIRDAVTAYLERENYWVTAVGDGQDALEEFQKHHFDLVILDLMLPRVPGERVCRVIRDTSDVPIIMLTACLLYTSLLRLAMRSSILLCAESARISRSSSICRRRGSFR